MDNLFLQDIAVPPEDAANIVPLCLPKTKMVQLRCDVRRFRSAVRLLEFWLGPDVYGSSYRWLTAPSLDLIEVLVRRREHILGAFATARELLPAFEGTYAHALGPGAELWHDEYYDTITTAYDLPALEKNFKACFYDGDKFDGGKRVILGNLGNRGAVMVYRCRHNCDTAEKLRQAQQEYDNLLQAVADTYTPDLIALGFEGDQEFHSPYGDLGGYSGILNLATMSKVKAARP